MMPYMYLCFQRPEGNCSEYVKKSKYPFALYGNYVTTKYTICNDLGINPSEAVFWNDFTLPLSQYARRLRRLLLTDTNDTSKTWMSGGGQANTQIRHSLQ